MAVQTLRPNGTLTNTVNPTYIGGSSTPHVILSDNSDPTYMLIEEWGTLVFAMGTYALAANERVKRWRFRLRGNAVNRWADDVSMALMDTTSGHNVSIRFLNMRVVQSGSPSTITGPWLVDGLNLSSQQALIDGLRTQIRPETTTGDNATNAGLQLNELYLDLDVWQEPSTPVVTTIPAGPIIETTDQPTIEVYTPARNDGTPTLWSRQIKVFRDEVYLASGFDPATETDVEWQDSRTSLPSVPTSATNPDAIQIGTPLPHNDTFKVFARYGKNDVAGRTLWSDWGEVEFTLDLELPTPPNVTATPEPSKNRVALTVDVPSLKYDTLEDVDVQRSSDDGTTWSRVRYDLAVFGPSDSFPLYDYEAPRGVSLLYRVRMTEGLESSDTTITSEWSTGIQFRLPTDHNWWLKDPLDPSRNMIFTPEGDSLERDHQLDIAHFRPLGSKYFVGVGDVARDSRITQLTIGTVGQKEYDELILLLKSMRTLVLQSPMTGNEEQMYATVDSPVAERLLNTTSLWRKLIVTFVPVEPLAT